MPQTTTHTHTQVPVVFFTKKIQVLKVIFDSKIDFQVKKTQIVLLLFKKKLLFLRFIISQPWKELKSENTPLADVP